MACAVFLIPDLHWPFSIKKKFSSFLRKKNIYSLKIYFVCVCMSVCICVCVTQRERKSEGGEWVRGGGEMEGGRADAHRGSWSYRGP